MQHYAFRVLCSERDKNIHINATLYAVVYALRLFSVKFHWRCSFVCFLLLFLFLTRHVVISWLPPPFSGVLSGGKSRGLLDPEGGRVPGACHSSNLSTFSSREEVPRTDARGARELRSAIRDILTVPNFFHFFFLFSRDMGTRWVHGYAALTPPASLHFQIMGKQKEKRRKERKGIGRDLPFSA